MAKTNETETERIAMLNKAIDTLDVVVAVALENPDDRGAIKMYLLGAYTVLHMTGIATTEEYDVLCEQAKTIGN
ncbi:MAG: hypothetical protein WC936_06885 [Candidatus Nanoarchaeia archaeon]